ncbi:Bug family tripartite tricarboxylate transporter substrate binding protein [Bordetella genomosp. 4]|uniref:Bug family tripartite tricarboxylate transporter substrate binding protein n=1 Tax=Bordetella genomosp. 4 TaxID=463044 RepID=UPI000B9E5060|nr:tripartite tricarboxylate transporter substrate binding protein [Bordetella genomosp. 4]OZI44338.1 ABC transporter substrate-binding protein [Bordetella genomosp. 4]
MITRRNFCLTATATLMLPTAWGAEQYPTRAINWIVPYPPGGQTDVTSRIVTARLGEAIKGTFVVDNRAGAGGTLGTEYAARAAADGYTVLYVSQATMAANLYLYKTLRYDPLKDFIPVHAMFRTPVVLVVDAARAEKTAQQFIALAKAHPKKLNFGSAGTGTGTHLSGVLFQDATGIELTHVPYKGSSPALNDLLGGRIDAMFDYLNVVGPQIKSGKLRALAVLGQDRLKAYPDIPTIVELGFPDAVSYSWSGVAVPAGTPQNIVKKLSDGLDETLRDPAVTGQFEENGAAAMLDIKLESFRRFIIEEQKKYAEIVRKSGATIN